MTRALLAALIAATPALIVPLSAGADEGLYLSHIDTVAATSMPDPGRATLKIDMAFADARKAAGIIGSATALTVTTKDESVLSLSVPPAATLRGGPEVEHLADSFVIDYPEPDVADLEARFRAGHEIGGRTGLIEELTRFVDAEVPEKTSKHGFRIASQVARDRAGDCTEHAVLLVALARALDLPARVAVGVLLVDDGEGPSAYGHAWAEIHDGESWQIADATRPEAALRGGWLRHVPLTSLDSEGTGFGMSALTWAVAMPASVRTIVEVAP